MKYKLTTNRKIHLFKAFYQIEALRDIPSQGVKKGDLGGWIQWTSNLDQNGDAWIPVNSMVYGKNFITDNKENITEGNQ